MKKVLIIEDSTTVTKILKHLINQRPEINPLFAGTFAEAQQLYLEHKEDLFAAIIDLSLPDAPNGEAVDFFLQQKVPSIVLTANYQTEKRQELMDKGVVDYIIKESRYSYNYALNLIGRLEKNQSIKILVAEDSKPTRTFIRILLKKHLYQVLEAENGVEALDALKENPDVKLLITDYQMPEMDGFELVRSLRHNIDKSDLVIIGLSAKGDGELSAKFIKNGANDFLQKPFYHEEFYCRITHNLEELELFERIKETASRDYLTNIYNRRYFFESGEVIHANALKQQSPLALAIIDIDDLKIINDDFGHRAGDRILIFLTEELSQSFSHFLVARTGDEQFCILMPNLNNEQAVTLVDGFRSIIGSMAVDIAEDPEPQNITISAGVTNILCENIDQQLHEADQLLNRAKEAGKNMVIGDDEETL